MDLMETRESGYVYLFRSLDSNQLIEIGVIEINPMISRGRFSPFFSVPAHQSIKTGCPSHRLDPSQGA